MCVHVIWENWQKKLFCNIIFPIGYDKKIRLDMSKWQPGSGRAADTQTECWHVAKEGGRKSVQVSSEQPL